MSTNDFLSGFYNEDEDELAVKNAPHPNALDADLYEDKDYTEVNEAAKLKDSTSDFEKIDKLIQANMRALRERYSGGGLKVSRVITSRILLEAPENYFERFTEDTREGVEYIQRALVDRDLSGLIGLSKERPTDEATQEKAFKPVQAIALEFLNKKVWSAVDKAILMQLLANEIIGFSMIDPLWRDKSINEIAVDGPTHIRIEVAGRWRDVRSCNFHSPSHLEQLIKKLYESKGKVPSAMTPRLKARLDDGSRLYTIHRQIMPYGPSLNIRRHSEANWAPVDLIEKGSASEEMLTEVGNLIYKGCSYLVVGSTSTGKTTMLNALTGFYRNDQRIITIEDSLEMKPNPHKMLVPGLETILPRPDRNFPGVTIRDNVQSSLQMAPDIIIVGEATGGEAYDLCQALNTGHAGASTLHANTIRDAIPRMLSLVGQGEVIQAEAALPLIGAAFDFIIFLEHSVIDGSRKISEIAEIPGYPEFDEAKKPYLNPRTIWKLDKTDSTWKRHEHISDDLIERRGLHLEPDLTWEQLKVLSKV